MNFCVKQVLNISDYNLAEETNRGKAMSEKKERSRIFKFFYVILSVITFPIFVVLFMLRHPIWTIFILLLIAGGAVYYPMSQGVKTDDLVTWYQNKFIDAQKELVVRAEQKGMKNFVPQAVVENVKKIEEEEKEKELEALQPKSENYNSKIDRDEKAEETKLKLKKRGGFKKLEKADEVVEVQQDENVAGENAVQENTKQEDATEEENNNAVEGASESEEVEQVPAVENMPVVNQEEITIQSETSVVDEGATVQDESSADKEKVTVQGEAPVAEEEKTSDESEDVSAIPQSNGGDTSENKEDLEFDF